MAEQTIKKQHVQRFNSYNSWFQQLTTPNSLSWLSFCIFATIFITLDIILSVLILRFVSYTEIDWVAYMQEVGGFLAGERDYTKLRGDTGPLVYPAGFVYIYSALYYITNSGQNIPLAQAIFAFLYIITNLIVSVIIYQSTLSPIICLPIIFLSKRLHSIYMLRCFNDCVAMFFMYVAILFLLQNRWYSCSFFSSLALSIKMNILLFFPGLAIIYLIKYNKQIFPLIYHTGIIIGVQMILASPFLITYPVQYISKSFEFSRVFTFIWTVNWKFLSEEVFISPMFSKTLLIIQLTSLLLTFGILDGRKLYDLWISGSLSHNHKIISPSLIISRLFISNFIGIVCSRSLHYQFYSWYAHQLPILLAIAFGLHQQQKQFSVQHTTLRLCFLYMMFFVIEWTWNVFPSTPTSSLTWQIVHWALFLGLLNQLPSLSFSHPVDHKI